MSRRAIVVTAGAAVALLAVWYLLLWSPAGGKLSAAKTRTVAAQTENEGLQLRLSRLRSAKENEEQLRTSFGRLEEAIPGHPELARFILDANQAATDAGVEWLSITPAPPAQVDAALPPTVSLQMNVTGTYSESLDYLDRMYGMPRTLVIDALALSPGGGTSADDLSIAMTARIFTTELPASALPVTPPTTVPAAGSSATPTTTVPAVHS